MILVLGLALGFRPEAGAVGAVSALALVVAFSFGLSWVFATLGLLLRSPSAVMNAGFMAIFPLTFLSNVFVDPATLPGPLRAFVDVNPVTLLAGRLPRPHGGHRHGGRRAAGPGDRGGPDAGLRAVDGAPVPARLTEPLVRHWADRPGSAGSTADRTLSGVAGRADQECRPPDGGGGTSGRDMDVLRRIRNGSAVAVTVGLLVTVVGAGVKFG